MGVVGGDGGGGGVMGAAENNINKEGTSGRRLLTAQRFNNHIPRCHGLSVIKNISPLNLNE